MTKENNREVFLKEIDLISVEQDGRELSLQYDLVNDRVKLSYNDRLTNDYVVKFFKREGNKLIEDKQILLKFL